ncbi:hypothetical protein P692DRAFT_201807379 [Suillus brevipes Sb2]|nr:hypothetical protein P692DRAFT_201807379 [Suillus brevipes Sb2]
MDPADEKYDNLDDIMLNTWDISREAEFAAWPSERVTYIRTGLHWELAILLQDVPNHIFAAHLMSIDTQTKGDDPSRIVDEYVWAWWISGISVNLSGPLPWDSIRKCVDNHPEGCALTIPAPQAQLGESSCLAQLLLMRERLRLIASEQVAEIETLLGQARVQAQTIERLGHNRDPRVMQAVALGLPVSLLWRDNL